MNTDPIDWKRFDDPSAVLLTDVFARTIDSLPRSQQPAAMQRLRSALRSPVAEIRRRASLTLAARGDRSGVPTLIDDLSKTSGRERDNVVVALRVVKNPQAIPALQRALQDRSPYVRGIAVAALGELKATAAYAAMVALTRDKEGLDRGKNGHISLNCLRDCPAFSACYALGALGDRRAVPVLTRLLSDPDLHAPARQALKALGQPKD